MPGLEAESAEFMSGEDGEECGALSDSLSRLRSPSVMEVREKGYERLKEELAKAQRVGCAHLGLCLHHAEDITTSASPRLI